MSTRCTRRSFVATSLLASAAVPAALSAESPAAIPVPGARETLPTGRIGGVEFTRLMLGGNLISGYAHSRDLPYVSHLMRQYNTETKIAETLETAEKHGINVINSWVQDGVTHLQNHWKRGGKIKWISQVRLNPDGNMDQIKKAADAGAAAIHPTGDTTDGLVREQRLDTLAKMVQFIREKKCVAGVGAHSLEGVLAAEKGGIAPDFYIKTLHTHDYHTAPKAGETDVLGRYDNSWCNDPEAVVDAMHTIARPWIAFKILAAGAIPPARGFRYAFDSGADFILVGMFDWQIAEDVQIAREAIATTKRTRPWRS